MIQGCHTLLYTSKPDELRAFFRDKLGFPYTDVGRGWLIFDLPEADLGCHPDGSADGKPSGTHRISFYCRDIEQTVKDLRARGVEFTDEIADVGYGLAIHFRVPGDFELELYQPRYHKT
jgi:catechol 2,3-dioxygenase-like lactoylglutathione lyase family enzyme